MGGPCLACFSCLLIEPDSRSQPLKFVHISALHPRQLVSYLYTYNNKLSSLPVPWRQCYRRTFLTSSCRFWQGKRYKVRGRCYSDLSCALPFSTNRHLIVVDCMEQTNQLVHYSNMFCVGFRFAIASWLHLQALRVPGDALPATFTYVGKSYSESFHVRI